MAILFTEDDIFWLEISVDDVVPVKMGQSLKNILNNEPGTIRIYPFAALDDFVELFSLKVFENDVNRVVSLVDSLKLIDVVVVELPHEGNFIY